MKTSQSIAWSCPNAHNKYQQVLLPWTRRLVSGDGKGRDLWRRTLGVDMMRGGSCVDDMCIYRYICPPPVMLSHMWWVMSFSYQGCVLACVLPRRPCRSTIAGSPPSPAARGGKEARTSIKRQSLLRTSVGHSIIAGWSNVLLIASPESVSN